jgi:hypothetical protein
MICGLPEDPTDVLENKTLHSILGLANSLALPTLVRWTDVVGLAHSAASSWHSVVSSAVATVGPASAVAAVAASAANMKILPMVRIEALPKCHGAG